MRGASIKFIQIIFFAVTLLFTSCGEWKDVKITKVNRMRVAKLDKNGIDAEIDVTINNPNKIGFTIFKSKVDVKMNDVSVGTARLKKKIKVKADEEAAYTFVIHGKFDNIIANGGVLNILSSLMSNSASVNLKGNVWVGKLFPVKKFPIDNKQRIPLIR
ncbi:MAG: LEA type 2 family protein [Bacteroidia bacterium]|nr:LEA type 2 family protein [Bacteroidia bacterium]